MIVTIEKNIFDHDAQSLIHQANCHCRMASGIARTINQLYPEAVAADNATIVGDTKKLGTFSKATGKDGKIIYNLYGQYFYGTDSRKTNYEAFYTGLSAIHTDLLKKGLQSASIPYNIGCGLAGGSWKIVSAIIEEVWENSPITLTICKFKP
jgi:O-acetyl-ADP-ribose deacetylase (regulator of RNase III)